MPDDPTVAEVEELLKADADTPTETVADNPAEPTEVQAVDPQGEPEADTPSEPAQTPVRTNEGWGQQLSQRMANTEKATAETQKLIREMAEALKANATRPAPAAAQSRIDEYEKQLETADLSDPEVVRTFHKGLISELRASDKRRQEDREARDREQREAEEKTRKDNEFFAAQAAQNGMNQKTVRALWDKAADDVADDPATNTVGACRLRFKQLMEIAKRVRTPKPSTLTSGARSQSVPVRVEGTRTAAAPFNPYQGEEELRRELMESGRHNLASELL